MMTFQCAGEPTCWRGEPVVDQCVSPVFQKILLMANAGEENQTAALAPQQTMEVASQLATATTSDVTQEDIAATSKVMKNLVMTNVKPAEAKRFVEDVVRAGSNLVSSNKTKVWTNMAKHDKIRSATSLLAAMETASVAMAEAISVPTTIVTKDDNIELELRVVDVTSIREDNEEEIVYEAEDSDNQFSIPMQTLSHLAKGGLAKVVFMTHYTIGDILQDTSSSSSASGGTDDGLTGTQEQKKNEVSPLQLASYILSASVSGNDQPVKLPKPISFTMRHIKDVPEDYYSVCSFWSIADSGLGEWSQEGCQVVRSNATQTTCECDHMTNFAVLMAVQEVELSDLHMSMLKLVTIVGCIISCVCLLASWITFTCFTSLQGERNSIHKNLVVCLFLAELLFVIGIDQTQNRLACGIVAGLLHFFFLSAFLWMLLEGVHIILMLVQVFDASRSRLPYYYAAAYGPPVLVIAISAGLFHQGYGTEKYCWLTTERYFIWSFAGPVAAILFANTIILIYSMTMVCRHSEYVFGGKDKTTAEGIRSWIQGAMALEVLLGLTWVIGFFFLNVNSVAVAYIFTVLNSTQGLYIFVFHCICNKKARKEYRRVMKVQRRPSMTTGSGTHSTLKNKNTLSGHSFNRHTNSTSGGAGNNYAENFNYRNV